SVNEIEPSVIAVDSLEARLSQFKIQYPDVHFGITGMQVVMRDEMDAGISDTMRNLAMAAVLILAIFVLSFRMWSGPLLALLVLLTGITWDIGLAQIVIGRLNIITVMCSIVLVGLGIDYAIHILSAYSEFRHKGETIEGAIAQAFQKIGSGLLTGALTTAVAFLSLTTIGSPAFKEFGFVTGAGIITCLLASIFLLPAAIVAKEKLWRLMTRREHLKRVDMEFRFLGRITRIATARPWVTVGIVLLITVALALQIPRVSMNRNYMDLEPEGLESIRLQRELVKRFHMSPDNMMAIYDSVEEVNQVQDRLYSQPAVGMVESIASVLPSEKKQRARLPYVRDIHEAQADLLAEVAIDTKALVEQLHRFSDNIIEISSMAYTSGLDRVFDKANQFVGLNEDGNQVGSNHAEELAGYLRDHPEAVVRLGDYQAFFRNIMKQRITEMSDTTMITLAMVPESFREHYVSADGSHFLMAFYSKNDVWDGLFTSPFLKTILRNAPQATGSPIFMREMVETTKREGIIAFAIALLAILLLLLVDFRSLLTAITALLPLLLAVIWLFGLMGALGIKVTIINVIGFPLLIGIGIDDGVHVIHRYRVEGKARLSYAMSSIGKAILLTSITTMLGFGSLVSSDFRGYIGLGLVVTIGIGLCFITSVIVLPAILKLLWGSRSWQPQLFIGAAVL
ncbi:MAG: MMPL family transporter, partial [candidate division Zixibacteria bacterium]|nr:MMPL family transporter [candidate division Zixibacteria bacterium]